MIDYALSEFGRRMGLDGFALGPDGLAGLNVAGLGRLYLELSRQAAVDDDELLMYVVRDVPPHDRNILREALKLCDCRHGHLKQLTVGRHGDQLLLLTRLREASVTPAEMENSVHFLSTMCGRLFA